MKTNNDVINSTNPNSFFTPSSASGSNSSIISQAITSVSNMPTAAQRFPSSSGISKITIARDKYLSLEQTTLNNKIQGAHDAMYIARAILGRNKKTKSPNKVNIKNRTLDENIDAAKALNASAKNTDKYEKQGSRLSYGVGTAEEGTVGGDFMHLMFAVKESTGRCGEMTDLVYSILDKFKYSPEIIQYEDEDEDGFNHAACIIKIEGCEYVVDPWANLISEKDKHLDELSKKIKYWNDKGKYVVMDNQCVEKIYHGNFTDSDYVTPSDILKLEIAWRETLDKQINLSAPSLFKELEKILTL